MNTNEINTILSCDPRSKKFFIGVFAANQLPRTPRKNTYAFVLNSDPDTLQGSHWTAVFVQRNRLNEPVLDFFCSFGRSYKEYGFPLKKYAKRIRYNTFQFQPNSSDTCGMHCIVFVQSRCIGVPYNTIINQIYNLNKHRNDQIALINMQLHFIRDKNKPCLK